MQAIIDCQKFEEEVEAWSIPDVSDLAGFQELSKFPDLTQNIVYPTCKIPCFHLDAVHIAEAHATFTKREDRAPLLLNTLFDLAILNHANISYIHTRIQLLSRYWVRTGKKLAQASPTLASIPEDRPLPDISEIVDSSVTGLKLQIQSLKADLKEIRNNQTGIKLALSGVRDAVAALTAHETEPKPIEADTAEVARQLQISVKEIQESLTELKLYAKSLTPEL